MSLLHQQHAMLAGLAVMGKPSLLEGVACGKANIERGVRVFRASAETDYDNHTVVFDVATLAASASPRVGKILAHPDGTFRLDRLLEDNGSTRRYVVVSVA